MPQSDWRARAGTTFRCEKQPATGMRGMVVTNHPLASAAGAEMLAAGGNAIDAAIAACFTLTVVEPMMVGILGGGMAHIRLADGRHVVIDNQSTAPLATGPTTFTPDPDAAPGTMDAIGRKNAVGPTAVASPGNLKGWCEALARFGTFPLADVMEPVPTKDVSTGNFVIGLNKVRPRVGPADGKPAVFKRTRDQKVNFWIQVYNLGVDAKTHKPINADERPVMYDPSSGKVAAFKKLGFEEHIYGLGEKAARLDKRRGVFTMWNSDTPAYKEGTDPIYQDIPFYLGWQAGTAYGIFFDNSFRTNFDFGTSLQEYSAFSADGGEMNYYFFWGPSIHKILGRYDAAESAEVERTFQLFAAIVKDAKEQKGLDKRENYFCRESPAAAAEDPNYTIRAWRAVVTYLLRRQEFLYE